MNLGQGCGGPLSAEEEAGQTTADPGTGTREQKDRVSTAPCVPVAYVSLAQLQRGKKEERKEEGRE